MHTQSSVRRFRKSAQLAQHELAHLLGVNQSGVSRMETGHLPDAQVVLGLQVLFDRAPDQLFEDRYQEVAEEVVGRAAALDLKLQKRCTKKHQPKRAWLHEVMARVTPRPA